MVMMLAQITDEERDTLEQILLLAASLPAPLVQYTRALGQLRKYMMIPSRTRGEYPRGYTEQRETRVRARWS